MFLNQVADCFNTFMLYVLLTDIGFGKQQGIGTLTTNLKMKEYNAKAESSNNYKKKNRWGND